MTTRIAQLPVSGPASDRCDALREDGAVGGGDLGTVDLVNPADLVESGRL